MIPLALSAATTIRTGQALGGGDVSKARLAGSTGILMCGVFMMFPAAFLLLFRDLVVGIYTTDPRVIEIAVSLLLMAAVFQVADGVQIGAAGCVAGLQRHAHADVDQHFLLLGARLSARLHGSHHLPGAAFLHLGRVRIGINCCGSAANDPVSYSFEENVGYGTLIDSGFTLTEGGCIAGQILVFLRRVVPAENGIAVRESSVLANDVCM